MRRPKVESATWQRGSRRMKARSCEGVGSRMEVLRVRHAVFGEVTSRAGAFYELKCDEKSSGD
jgi:hypothetical protein